MLCVHRYAEELRQRQGTEEEEKEEQESLLQEGGRRRCGPKTMHCLAPSAACLIVMFTASVGMHKVPKCHQSVICSFFLSPVVGFVM